MAPAKDEDVPVPTTRMGLKEQEATAPSLVLGVCRVTGSLEPLLEPKGTRGNQRQPQGQRHASSTLSRAPSRVTGWFRPLGAPSRPLRYPARARGQMASLGAPVTGHLDRPEVGRAATVRAHRTGVMRPPEQSRAYFFVLRPDESGLQRAPTFFWTCYKTASWTAGEVRASGTRTTSPTGAEVCSTTRRNPWSSPDTSSRLRRAGSGSTRVSR
jgi:hypothetical protein